MLFWSLHRCTGTTAHTSQGPVSHPHSIPSGPRTSSKLNNCWLPLKKIKQPANAFSELIVSSLMRLLLSYYSQIQS